MRSKKLRTSFIKLQIASIYSTSNSMYLKLRFFFPKKDDFIYMECSFGF